MREIGIVMDATGSCIAAVIGAESTTVQALFRQAVARWRSSGLKVVGMIEETHDLKNRVCSAGILRDIASNASFPIYLETLPAGATCHIDGEGAARASDALIPQVAASDVVVLSKYGKLEAGGSGLINVFQMAKTDGKFLLTAVSDKHKLAWEAFAPDAIPVEPTVEALTAWLDAAQRPLRH
jgi:hypothetical protein